jgi:hypothetical protein
MKAIATAFADIICKYATFSFIGNAFDDDVFASRDKLT